ncbi:hypothetical protein [Nonomuraea africana]|uniref:DUF3995 domain-containing protein n=1 Tax=Nonomuraea africana TaxID=46171 RepID=A0ABR9KWU7_9ACTN|nr:hypothetical protein [Nonomuraea africana]MBE1566205.1 hypothetical protein [Nonomuraea africana]
MNETETVPVTRGETAARWSWIAPAAGLWSLSFGLVGAYWAFGGTGFPLGAGDPRAGQVGSLLAAAEPGTAGAVMAALGLLGGPAALAMGRPAVRRPSLVFAWLMCVGLVVVVPDVRVIQNFGYLFMGHTGLWDGPLLFMLYCVVGGALWGAAAWNHREGGGPGARSVGWGRPVTYLAAVLALPYGISRISWAMGIPLGVPEGFVEAGQQSAWAVEAMLGGLCVAGAILTLGLIQRWGEVFPRWIPFLRGRRVPVWLAVAPALCAAAMLIQAGSRLYLWMVTGEITMTADTWGAFGPGLSWLPWGLALVAATYAYYLRRRARP